jgi:transketolase
MDASSLDELCINTIRFLSVDAVEKAKSGHPGTPMGASTIVYVLWDKFLKHNPSYSQWPDRDRFVLSSGHASMLLYSILYLTGYDITLDDIKEFRQWDSKTPGHPEYGRTPGVEVTTGPLGQGFANGVGMAIAERILAQRYNRPGHEVINHYTYALVSDGDLEEGVGSEAASLAGNLRLGKLIYLYDSNDVQQDGPTISFTENVSQRFQSYGWNVIGPVDGMNTVTVGEAIGKAKSQVDRPTLIICKTVIGYGSPNKAGTNAAHGEPLGPEETILAKKNLKWDYPDAFHVPPEALNHFRQAVELGKIQDKEWQQKLEDYRQSYPQESRQLEEDLKGNLPRNWDQKLTGLFGDITKPISTREASGKIVNTIADSVPAFIGGAADLAGSTRTVLQSYGDFTADTYNGRNIRYGLREHAMGAITNGLALHGGLVPFAATFFIFSDYMRPPMRLASIMKLHITYVFTHDSVGLGEDGPTHQPIEQLTGLRLMPNLVLIRPADATEVVEAWKIAMERREGPTALIFTRQNLPVLDRSILNPANGVQRGGYILSEPDRPPQVILIGTGSEVHIALEASHTLGSKGIAARVVSLPSWEIFDAQPREYRELVLPPQIRARVSIEAGATVGWERYVGLDGTAIGLDRFGASAPGVTIYQKLGLTAQRLTEAALKLL